MEQTLSAHSDARWRRRRLELASWTDRPKRRRRAKQIAWLGNIEVDAELLAPLALLRRMRIETEYSCAGVSPLDEPEDHSLYAYITLIASERAERFVQYAMRRMRHRLLVAFDPAQRRYDLSSFFIGHNRSFCLLLGHCAESFAAQERERGE